MKAILLFLLLFIKSYQSQVTPRTSDLEQVLNLVLNQSELANFTNNYINKGEIVYFRFGPSPVYDKHTLASMKGIVIKIKNGPPLVYDTCQNEKQLPIIYVKIMRLNPDAAQVRIGFDIEGAVGVFTLVKKENWTITEQDVYEI
jgi:hypothetical protein